jgi:uncharacterized protein (TIGR00730 family)
MRSLKSICVYCGSSPGKHPSYAEAAKDLGGLLASEGIRLIFGGGAVGLMGIVASAAMDAGGEVVGVIPQALDRREIANRHISELRIVESMHERKSLMNDLADGFIALPGGYGTFEELCETLTWVQLGIHDKPVGLLDVDGYYQPLMRMFDHAVAERFLHPDHRRLLVNDTDARRLLDQLRRQEPARTQKWLDRDER